MEWTVDEIRKIQKIMYETDVVSLDKLVADEESEQGDTTLMNMISNDEQSLEDTVLEKCGNELLIQYVEKLSPREQIVIKMRYGLIDGRVKSLEEVGKTFNVTRERIRQIEANALRKLKMYMRKHNLNYSTFR